MCTTCGCSDDGAARVIDLSAREAHDDHHHHDHDHDRDDHDHHHAHGHEHEHGHEHRSARIVRLEQDVLAKNGSIAARNRRWLEARGIAACNLMSSPGAGKTTLLERTIRDLGDLTLAVVEGDQATVRDAERIRATGCRVVQINTGAGCHLDAAMLAEALRTLDPPARALVMIENVGNLVCPALFDLGERTRVALMSVTEGEDKPLKYPYMFRAADLMILTKTDLLPHLHFDVEACLAAARRVNPRLEILALSATSGEGLEQWYGWLRRPLAAASRPRA